MTSIILAAPRFDMGPTKSWDQAAEMGVDSSTDNSVNPELSLAMTPTKEWETDVRALISTKKWLSIYGLKKNRLDMFHIMPQIGFKHSEGKTIYILSDPAELSTLS